MTREEVVRRARSQIDAPIAYRLGTGGMDPTEESPSFGVGLCDCSGFTAWCLGLSRVQPHDPFYARYGGWMFTDSIYADALSPFGQFTKAESPAPGDLIVFPHRQAGHHGHVGVVTQVTGAKAPRVSKVVHCSPRNGPRAIQETGPEVFEAHGAIVVTHAQFLV